MAHLELQAIERNWAPISWAEAPTTVSVAREVAELVPLPEIDAVEAEWCALQAASDHSFFQSWGWIGNWLRLIPADSRCLLLRVRRDKHTVGLAILVERTVWRRGFVRSRAVRLNETGRPEIDKLAIEHNGILVRRDCAAAAERAALRRIVEEIRAGRWDEAVLSGVGPLTRQSAETATADGPELLVLRHEPSHIIDLDVLRERGGVIPDALRAGLRKDVRRALRGAEEFGTPRIEAAGTTAEALEFLDALIALHEVRWTGAGEIGAFFAPWLRRFHTALVASRFAAGEIQLLKVSIGDVPIGYLYHFLYGDRLYAYQWGLLGNPPWPIRTGLICDALSLHHNMAGPVRVFDFLHGDTEYKRRFGTRHEERFWLVLQRPRLRFWIENALRKARRRLGLVPRLA